jgi:hypothetical protein
LIVAKVVVVKDSVAQVRGDKAVVKDSVAQVRGDKVVVVKDSVAQVKGDKAAQRLPADVKVSQAGPVAANPEIRITRYFQQSGPVAAFFLFNQNISEK